MCSLTCTFAICTDLKQTSPEGAHIADISLTLSGLGVGALEGVAVDLALVDCRDCRLVKALDSLSSEIPCNSVSSSTSGLEDSKMFVGK